MKLDKNYIDIFLAPIQTCKQYQPKFGQNEKGIDLNSFKKLYGEDAFYSWIGLNSDLMYAAHKAAGGMTSIYRQIGIGCERLFRQIILDNADYDSPEWATWSYETTKTVIRNNQPKQEKRILTLDGRLEFSKINNVNVINALNDWVERYCKKIDSNIPNKGVVFEVRQGYKSKDSKRQNADIANISTAWAKGYLPVFAIFSTQIDLDNMNRYLNSRAGVLLGSTSKDDCISLFSFCYSVLQYDLENFFYRNSTIIKSEIENILEKLLSAK